MNLIKRLRISLKSAVPNLLDSTRLLQNTESWQNEAMIVVLNKCEAREAPFFGSLSLSDLAKRC